jgi:hypothetical protein
MPHVRHLLRHCGIHLQKYGFCVDLSRSPGTPAVLDCGTKTELDQLHHSLIPVFRKTHQTPFVDEHAMSLSIEARLHIEQRVHVIVGEITFQQYAAIGETIRQARGNLLPPRNHGRLVDLEERNV